MDPTSEALLNPSTEVELPADDIASETLLTQPGTPPPIIFDEVTNDGDSKFIVPSVLTGQNLSMSETPTKCAAIPTEVLLPFPCDLCAERFPKKLLLNNHVERRHGIKFVFTQKGQKVKLVRMPEFLHEGEKLDPCVQLLLQASDKKQRKNIIGVQAMDAPDQQMNYQSQLHQEINTQELLKGQDGLGIAFLIGNITNDAIKYAVRNCETPFAVFSPHNSEKLFLLCIVQMNATKQMLFPAKVDDLVKGSGVHTEEYTYFTQKEPTQRDPTSDEAVAGPSSDAVKRTRQTFSHVAVVAIVKQVITEDNGICNLVIQPSAPQTLDNVEIADPKEFVRLCIQNKLKRLRCFSETTSLITTPPVPVKEPPKPKRKYVRKSMQASVEEQTSDDVLESTNETEDASQIETQNEIETQTEVKPKVKECKTPRRKRKNRSDDEDSDYDGDDETYKPIPKSTRRRGRPNKMAKLDESSTVAESNQGTPVENTSKESALDEGENVSEERSKRRIKRKKDPDFVPSGKGSNTKSKIKKVDIAFLKNENIKNLTEVEFREKVDVYTFNTNDEDNPPATTCSEVIKVPANDVKKRGRKKKEAPKDFVIEDTSEGSVFTPFREVCFGLEQEAKANVPFTPLKADPEDEVKTKAKGNEPLNNISNLNAPVEMYGKVNRRQSIRLYAKRLSMENVKL